MEGPNLGTLPPKCLLRIFSFVIFAKVSQLREVCSTFDKIGARVLNKGRRELKDRLQREMAKAVERALCPGNPRVSYDLYHFLADMLRVINKCTLSYLHYFDVNNYYFVAGKVLDEARGLLEDLDGSTTTLPYFQENICDQMPHPLLDPLISLMAKAFCHFEAEIAGKFLLSEEQANGEIEYRPVRYDHQFRADLKLLREGIKMIKEKRNRISEQGRKIWSGEQLNRDLLGRMRTFNQSLLDLTEKTKRTNEKLDERFKAKTKTFSTFDNNKCSRSASPTPLGSLNDPAIKKTKILRNVDKNRANLGTLPSPCLRRIVSYLNYGKTSQLRMVCTSFDEACKKELNEGCELLKRHLEYGTKAEQIYCTLFPQTSIFCRVLRIYLNFSKDLIAHLLRCEDLYKRYLGEDYRFIAGKVLDEVRALYRMTMYGSRQCEPNPGRKFLDENYSDTPHSALFGLMEMVKAAVAHSKLLRSTRNNEYVSDDVASGSMIRFGRKKEKRLQMEKLNRVLEEQELKIKNQNERNKKSLKIVSRFEKTLKMAKNRVLERCETVERLEALFLLPSIKNTISNLEQINDCKL